MKTIKWKEVLLSFRHRWAVYSEDAKAAVDDVYAAFLEGKSEGYRDIVVGINEMRKFRHGLKSMLNNLKLRHRDFMKQSARLADDPVESASFEGYAQANREAARDLLAAAGKLPYREV